MIIMYNLSGMLIFSDFKTIFHPTSGKRPTKNGQGFKKMLKYALKHGHGHADEESDFNNASNMICICVAKMKL